MGYTTDFYGAFDLDKPLTVDQAAYLKMFSHTRRMARDPKKILKLEKPNQECLDLLKKVGLDLGPQGEHYCSGGDFGQDADESILDYNSSGNKSILDSSGNQPGLWCQWVPTNDRKGIEWDGGEKFYAYVEWIIFIIEHFLKPWGRTLVPGRVPKDLARKIDAGNPHPAQ
jgi:hypothetical protein